MSRIKNRISSLVSSQLPEFVREEYTVFVAFLEAYYKFLEQDQNAQELIQNALDYSDIDKTAPSFVNYFLTNYGNLIPQTVLVNKQLLVKRLNDLYSAKGSELSFKLLFRILFDKSVILKKPYDYVLIPSDGRWEQQVSVRVTKTSGSANDILDRYLNLEKNGIIYRASITRVKNLAANQYELFISARTIPPYAIGDEVTVQSTTSTLFVGNITPTTTSFVIGSGGAGFKKDQVFTVNFLSGVNTVVKIKSVNASGSITDLKILSYGFGYTSDFTVDLYKNLTISARSLSSATTTNSISETLTISRVFLGTESERYFLNDYVEEGYNGESYNYTLANDGIVGATVNTTESPDPDAASITFKVGPVSRYPGQYITNNGFLSEPDIRLQDDKLYQPFAYQLETEVDITKFYDIVKKLIHPAGTELYNNRVITISANIKSNVSVVTRSNLFSEAYSTFDITDNNKITFYKTLSDEFTSEDTTPVITIYKNVESVLSAPSDNTTTTLSFVLESNTLAIENIANLDSNIILTTDTVEPTENIYAYRSVVNYDEQQNILETMLFNFSSLLTDSSAVVDTVQIAPAVVASDSSSMVDNGTVIQQNIAIAESTVGVDSASMSQDTTYTEVSELYFAEDYSATTNVYSI